MRIKLLENAQMPKKGREDDAAWDVFLPEDIIIQPHSDFCINTNLCLELPEGYAAMFVPRSSSAKKGIYVSNCLIDSNYRGPVHILGFNLNNDILEYKQGDRIASLLIFPIFNGKLEQAKELSETNRGSSWNGSSGK